MFQIIPPDQYKFSISVYLFGRPLEVVLVIINLVLFSCTSFVMLDLIPTISDNDDDDDDDLFLWYG